MFELSSLGQEWQSLLGSKCLENMYLNFDSLPKFQVFESALILSAAVMR